MQDFGDCRPDIGADPADPGPDLEDRRRYQESFGHAAVVVRVVDGSVRIGGQDYFDGRRCCFEPACLGEPGAVDCPERGGIRDDDEPPGLAVLAAPRPAGDVDERIDDSRIDGLAVELPILTRATKGSKAIEWA